MSRRGEVVAGVLENYLTLAELAGEAGVSERTVRRWLDAGLPYIKLGGRRLVNRDDFLAWLEGCKVL